MPTFPLSRRPAQSYRNTAARFGDDRGDILHPGCDLVAVAGTEIFAVEDGEVIYGPRLFFESGPHVKNDDGVWVCQPGVKCLWVYDILIKHSTFLGRYGEVALKAAPGIKQGETVKEGQLVGYVGAQTVKSMLHFEMFGNPDDLSYPTVKGNMKYLNFKPSKTYSRRKDLMDPTEYLDSCTEKG